MHWHRVRALVVAAAAVALLAVPAAAGTITVPGDYGTIQLAVDNALAGDRILVGPGTYDEAVVVDGKNDLQILGRNLPAVTGTGGMAAFVVRNCEGTRVSGFLVDSGAAGVVVSNATGIRIEKITVLQSTGSGVRVQVCDDVLVKSCRVEGATQAAFVVQDPAGVRLEKCTVLGGAGHGIQVAAQPTLRGPFGFAALVQKNSVEGATGSGVDAVGAGVIVQKNRIGGASQDGVRCDGAVAGASVVAKNRIAAVTGAAVALTGQEVLVSKNRVEACGSGIQAGGTGIHVLEKNRLLLVLGDAIVVSSAGNTLVKNNVLGSTGHGVNLQTTGNTLEKNKAAGSGGFDLLSAVLESENTFLENRFLTISFP